MSSTIQRWCLWCGPVMIVLWLGGFAALSHFVIPPPPGVPAEVTAQMYQERNLPIKLGLFLTTGGSALLGPFLMAIAVQMKRIEGRFSPLTYIQIGFGAIFVLEFIGPAMLMQVAAYRPERSPEIIQALNDIGWMLFVGIASTIVIEQLAVGTAILIDRRRVPVYPRWTGYLSILTGMMIIPSNALVFFQHGPMAWNGLFAWYLPVAFYATWVVVMLVMTLRAVTRFESDEPTAGSDSADDLRARVDDLTFELDELRSLLARDAPTRLS